MVSLNRLCIALFHNANMTLVNTDNPPSGRSWNVKHNVADVGKHIKAAVWKGLSKAGSDGCEVNFMQ